MAVPALEAHGLTRAFGSRVVVDDLDLMVAEGDVYGFLGPNGAGKTTAMRCMLGLIRPNAGTVRIFGETDPVRARRHVGAIIESPAFHGWMSGRANLEQAARYAGLSGALADAEIERVLLRVGLRERARDKAGTYSMGMKQRLAIARALLGGPRLLVLDEPTNGLDPAGMREMREFIRSLALHDKITIFISSHMLTEVQAICNRVGIIRDGTLRAEGRVDDLLGQGVDQQVVEFSSPDMAALEEALREHEGAEPLGPGRSGRLLVRIDVRTTREALVADLVAAGVGVSALVPTERDLEDVFLEVTR